MKHQLILCDGHVMALCREKEKPVLRGVSKTGFLGKFKKLLGLNSNQIIKASR